MAFNKSSRPNKAGLQKFRIYMTSDGKIKEDGKATVVEIEEDCEFNAVWAAEHQYPRLKVAKVEKA